MSDLLNKASLVMVPSGYKEDTVFSVVPSDGSGDLAFTRASNGTRVNSAGLVEVCPWNLVEYSEDFVNSVWTKSLSTITGNATIAPNGTTTADRLQISNSARGVVLYIYSTSAGTTLTFSVYAKANGQNLLRLFCDQTCTYFQGATIVTLTNEWVRYSLTVTASQTGTIVFGFDNVSDSTTTCGGTNGTTDCYIWGAQLNIGSTAKPYFPTTDRLNVPRLTYQNGGGGCPSLLLEKQSTNLVTYSEDFTQWTTLNTTVTANNITSPDGTQNADVIAETTVNSEHQFASSSVSFLASTKYTATIFAKWDAACTRNIHIRLGNCPSVNCGASFDKNGNFVNYTGGGNGTLDSYSSVDMGNGWRRFVVTITTTTTASSGSGIFVYFMNGTSLGYAGSTSQKINFYGAQLEASSYPTSYIPTTSSSATRVADACYKTGISSLIGQSQGTMFVDSVLTHSATTNEYLIQVSESASNRFFIYREAGTNKLGCFARVGSTTIYTQLTSGAITGRVKAVFTYQSGSFAFYVNGTQIGVSTATFSTPPTMDRLDIDSNAGAENGYYNYNEAILFKTRLTNAELQAITTI